MTRLLYFLERKRSRIEWVLLYVMLIPFIRPRGFDEVWDWYTTVFDLWLYGALALIFCWVVYDFFQNGLKYKACAYAMAVYYVLFVAITLIQQKGINEGLQKMFAAPALFMFCMVALKNKPREFLIALVNVLTVIFGLNVTILCPIITDRLIGVYHVNFLGHVQVVAQYSLVGCLAAYLLAKMDGRRKRRCILLVALCLLQTLWAKTAAGLLVIAILAGGVILRSLPRFRPLTVCNPQIFFGGYVAINALMLLFSFTGLDRMFESLFSFSGRTLIWRETFKLIIQHPILGYGAYGAKIVVPWSPGMNYAHNEFIQRLLDGGIVLCVAYIVMLYTFVQAVQKVKNKRVLSVINICLLGFLVVMLFESVTDYFFIIVFLCIMAYTPEILEYRKNRWGGEPL